MHKKVFRIGVIGQGFVGGSLAQVLSEKAKANDIKLNLNIYDKFKPELSTCEGFEEVSKKSDVIFVCVPTPMFKSTGACDVGIVQSVLTELNNHCEGQTIVIKSTVPPGTTRDFQKKFKFLNLVFNPEFLREATALEDTRNQDKIVLGGQRLSKVVELYEVFFFGVPIIKTDSTTAEMAKNTINAYLATKISFANEMYQICQKLSVDFNKVTDIIKLDNRLGLWGWQVPGDIEVHNNEKAYGYGGHCLPKDLNSLIYVAKSLGVDSKILKSAWEKNLEVRKEEDRDWELMKNRAVTD